MFPGMYMHGKAPTDKKATPYQSVNKASSIARASKRGCRTVWREGWEQWIYISQQDSGKKKRGRGVWGNPLEPNKARRDFQPHGGRPRSGSETNGIQTVSHDWDVGSRNYSTTARPLVQRGKDSSIRSCGWGWREGGSMERWGSRQGSMPKEGRKDGWIGGGPALLKACRGREECCKIWPRINVIMRREWQKVDAVKEKKRLL